MVEFIREDNVTLFEGKTIMSGRRGVYIQEKEKHKLENMEEKKLLELNLNSKST